MLSAIETECHHSAIASGDTQFLVDNIDVTHVAIQYFYVTDLGHVNSPFHVLASLPARWLRYFFKRLY